MVSRLVVCRTRSNPLFVGTPISRVKHHLVRWWRGAGAPAHRHEVREVLPELIEPLPVIKALRQARG